MIYGKTHGYVCIIWFTITKKQKQKTKKKNKTKNKTKNKAKQRQQKKWF